jgi:hypothetical protein
MKLANILPNRLSIIFATYGHVEDMYEEAQRYLPYWLQASDRHRQEALLQFYRRAKFVIHPLSFCNHVGKCLMWSGHTNCVKDVGRDEYIHDTLDLRYARYVSLHSHVFTYWGLRPEWKPKACANCGQPKVRATAPTKLRWLSRHCSSLRDVTVHFEEVPCYREVLYPTKCPWCELWFILRHRLGKCVAGITDPAGVKRRTEISSPLKKLFTGVVTLSRERMCQQNEVSITFGGSGWHSDVYNNIVRTLFLPAK